MEKHREILHIDMNAFFASCEQALNPELKGLPLIVGGDPKKRTGIVLAASYEAKKHGVKTAMTIVEALRLCQNAYVMKPTKGLYTTISQKIMTIFDDFTPLKEQISIDEAFLDMTGTEHLFGSSLEAAKIIQKRIKEELDIPSSVGISSNKLLAKMASDYKKPMGITTIYPYEIKEKLWPLPIEELYGVGRKTAPKLHTLGIKTIGDLAEKSIEELKQKFGEKYANYMHRSANGIASDRLNEGIKEKAKSVGNEITFPKDITEYHDGERALLKLSDKVSGRLRKKKYKGKTITLKIKYSDFKVITRSTTIHYYTDSSDEIFKHSKELLCHNMKKPIRLIGVTVSNMEEEMIKQLSLFQEEMPTEKIDIMVDQIRDKFGFEAIGRGSIYKKEKHNQE